MASTTSDKSTSSLQEQLRKPRSAFQKLVERGVELGLLGSGLLSIAITVTIALVVFKGSFDFFRDS